MTLNPAGTFAYAISNTNGQIYYCPVQSNGSLGSCNTSGGVATSPIALAFNYAGSYLYVTNQTSNVVYCSVNSDGSIGTCNTISGFSTLNNLAGIMFNGASTYVYLVDGNPTNTVTYCTINFNGSFNACNTIGSGFINIINPFGIAIS